MWRIFPPKDLENTVPKIRMRCFFFFSNKANVDNFANKYLIQYLFTCCLLVLHVTCTIGK